MVIKIFLCYEFRDIARLTDTGGESATIGGMMTHSLFWTLVFLRVGVESPLKILFLSGIPSSTDNLSGVMSITSPVQ